MFILPAFDACLPLSSPYSDLVGFKPLTQSRHIGNQNFVSLHSGFIVIDLMKQLTCNVGIIYAMLALFLLFLLSFVPVWCRCDLLNVSLYTWYVSLYNLTPLHLTWSKLIFIVLLVITYVSAI